MRGCLTSLLLVAVLVAAAAWFLTPLAVDALVGASLTGAGFSGSGTTVDAMADPPPALLTGHADTIRIKSTDVTFNELRAASLDLTLHDVGLLSRSIASVDGTLQGVRIVPATGATMEATSATIAGNPAAARVHLSLDAAQVIGLVAPAIASAIGPSPSSTQLAAPDRVLFSLAGRSGNGLIQVDGGALTLRAVGLDAGPIVLLAPAPGSIWRVSSATISGGRLELGLLVDLRTLVR